VNAAGRAAAAFRARYGSAPAGVWTAPGRVNLIGEHTDYNDGFVLPFALPLATAVAAGRDDSPSWTVWSDGVGEASFGPDDLVPGRLPGWVAYVAGVVWALRQAGEPVPGAALAVTSDLPMGAGLSSSAALECAVLAALADLGRLDLPRAEWPRLAQRAEHELAGVPCGIMDQSASVLAQAGHALFLDCRTLAAEQIPLRLGDRGLALLVIDSHAPHRHVDTEYAERRATCARAAAALGVAALRDVAVADLPGLNLDAATRRRVRHVVTENQRVLDAAALLRTGGPDPTALGELLTASHASMRDDYEVTVPEIDAVVDAALAAGAYGARMTGGGFGGCVLALVDADRAEPVGAAVAAASRRAGYAEPTWFVAEPADGVRRTG
jgi:galactokinase